VGSPVQTHGVLLPLLSKCFPVLDEICRRSLHFVRSCIRYESAVHVLDGKWYIVRNGSTVPLMIYFMVVNRSLLILT